MTQRLFKYNLPVDDTVHKIRMKGQILHVGNELASIITIYTVATDEQEEGDRRFSTFRAGDAVPKTASYVGTCRDHLTHLVWHLYEFPLEDKK